MRPLRFARLAGREERRRVGDVPERLAARLLTYLKDREIDVVAVSDEQLNGGRAEVDAASGVIQYNERLNETELIEALAHELGHLVMHERLTDPDAAFDPVLASAYSDTGPASISRYSARVREEAEANAFAVAFVCPDDLLFEAWVSDAEATIEALAQKMEVRPDVIRVQLANVVYDLAIGRSADQPSEGPKLQPTADQTKAATATGRPILVDAGPGTGKTSTLTERADFLLKNEGVSPRQILVLTFSNETAQEITERLDRRFGREVANEITTSTFHGLGMEFLHLHCGLLGFDNDPLLIDEDTQAETMYEVVGKVPCQTLIVLRDPWETAEKLVEHVNHCKHLLITPDIVEDEAAKWAMNGANETQAAAARELAAVYREYERLKREREQVDFADLIWLPLQLLESNTTVREGWRTKFPSVLVDEFQDVSRATSRLLRALCGDDNPPWVVGDARQAIYQFLGAHPDNVSAFGTDFPGAEVLPLEINYRSAEAIVASANDLANLMNPNRPTRWESGSSVLALGSEPVMIAEATSDRSERAGIAEQVRKWIHEDFVEPGEIAVLARRHVDVRETMLALENAGIRAQAAGLLTAEGAAGDLAAAVTLVDSQLASIPRLVYAFGRDSAASSDLNEIVSALLENKQTESGIARIIEAARDASDRERFTADGWATLTTFLFESSPYLRRILAKPDTAERALSLIEIVSTLSLAVSYRSTHRGIAPRTARIGFAERLRVRLTATVPLPLMPKPRADSVRVMTCHASKGMEFPCVIVSSQTMPVVREKYPWLSPSLRPSTNEEIEQANSLLFVGVTRAKRAVIVSYPTHAGGTALARGKKVVPLLEQWSALGRVPVRYWSEGTDHTIAVIAGPLWGVRARSVIKASALDSDACPLLTYLEQYLGIRFPEEETVLYPRFFGTVRRVLRRLAIRANELGRPLGDDDVLGILEEEWPAERFQDHPHYAMYRGIAKDLALSFAREFAAVSGSAVIEPEIRLDADVNMPVVSLDLVAYFRQPNGQTLAILFRPESLAAKVKDNELLWSKLDQNKRISLVLAESPWGAGKLLPHVFSGMDGRLYVFLWSKLKTSLENQTAELINQFNALAHFDFTTEATPYKCDRCRARVTCPHWLGALES